MSYTRQTTRRVASLALAAFLATAPAVAQDCSSSVQTAQDNIRQSFIQGMSGLITNGISGRPSSFASMACLDKFMQGNMDIMFKPPSLTDLLGTVMNFACQQARQIGSSSSASPNLNGLIGSLAGGLNFGGGSGVVNLSQVLSSGLSGGGGGGFGGGFGSGGGSGGGAGNGGGIRGLYNVGGR